MSVSVFHIYQCDFESVMDERRETVTLSPLCWSRRRGRGRWREEKKSKSGGGEKGKLVKIECL